MNHKLLFLSILLLVAFQATAGIVRMPDGYYSNPVIRGDVPDPSIIRIGETYYATGTSSEWAPLYPVFESKDLVNWTQVGSVFNEPPAWTSHSFWAPELFCADGKVYCYYTARRKSDGVSYIGVAVSDSPEKEFTDHGPVVQFGNESIDAFVFEAEGDRYITFKAYGLDKRPIEILCYRLSKDGLRVEGEPFALLRDDDRIGMEGQCVFFRDGWWYILYAARGCCGPRSDYEVRVARSRDFKGPYEYDPGNPIMRGGNEEFQACGHGTVVLSPEGRMFFMCHAYLAGDDFYLGRQPILVELEVTEDGWIRSTTGKYAPLTAKTPFPGTRQLPQDGFHDSFRGKELCQGWMWNYPYSKPDIRLRRGKLFLSGTPKEDIPAGKWRGTALCRRATVSAYSIETKVYARGEGQKGLTVYGDNSNYAFLAVEDGKVSLISNVRGVETVVYQVPCKAKSVKLRCEVDPLSSLRFFWKARGKWVEVPSDLSAAALIQWDRMFRPGLLNRGNTSEPAVFDYFKMVP
ncbi:MAG: family 43 glycosylhydrolase [Bacteroidales bacterium]|nr:family 43 glycosylhydrolase [Bacteroidales bacterium]